MSIISLTDGRLFKLADLTPKFQVEIKENILSITKASILDNKKEKYKITLDNMKNEIVKRKQDIKLLEKSYEELTNNLKVNFDLTREQESSRELFTLLGQINKHILTIKELEQNSDILVNYETTTTYETIYLELNKLTDVDTFFGQNKVLALWTDTVVKSKQNITTTTEKNTINIDKHSENQPIYIESYNLWFHGFIINEDDNTYTIHYRGSPYYDNVVVKKNQNIVSVTKQDGVAIRPIGTSCICELCI